MSEISIPPPRKREFLPIEFRLTVWSRLKPYCNELLLRPINNAQALTQWLHHRDEIAWLLASEWQCRKKRLAQKHPSEMAQAEIDYLAEEILPKALRIADQLDAKLKTIPGGQNQSNYLLQAFWEQHCI